MRRIAILIIGALLASCQRLDAIPARSAGQDIKVLDGDTVILDGKLVRVAGIDAPELGPWAKCWAEAGLGGVSRSVLENLLFSRREEKWELSQPTPPDVRGRIRANLVTAKGGDVQDHMVVNGYAARTDGKWDWCGANANLHSPLEGEPVPHGPNLWWPANQMYDSRAGD